MTIKDIVITVVASIVASSACFWGLQFATEDGGPYASTSEAEKLSVGVEGNTEAITSLRLEILAIRDLMNLKEVSLKSVATATMYDEPDDLTERIQALEDVVEALSSSKYGSINKASDSPQGRIIHRLSELTESSALQQNPVAESAFENDSGVVPLNDYTDSLEGALHAVDSIDVKGMDCRDTICKITYSNSESLTAEEENDSEIELMEKLIDGVQGRDLDIRYAKDGQGNHVMYVQLQ